MYRLWGRGGGGGEGGVKEEKTPFRKGIKTMKYREAALSKQPAVQFHLNVGYQQ